MSTSEVRRVLRIIREEAQAPSVSFTGGVPALRADLAELVSYARQDLGLRVNLITNGTLIDAALARRLSDAGLNSAQASLESPDERVHDALTRSPGSYRLTIEAISHLRACDVPVHTNTTINRANMHTVTAMPALVRNLGLERFSMNLVIPMGDSRFAGDLNLRYPEVPHLILEIQQQAKRHHVEFLWYSPTPLCIFNPIQHRLGNKGCAACDGLLSVSPSGDVLPCSSWPEPVGNLLRDEFRQVWESARGRWLREKQFAPPLCRGCQDFPACQGGCPLYWRHFGHEELREHGERYVTAGSSRKR